MVLLDLLVRRKSSASLVVIEGLVITLLGAVVLGFWAGREGLSGLPGVVVVYPLIFISMYYYTSELRKRWSGRLDD